MNSHLTKRGRSGREVIERPHPKKWPGSAGSCPRRREPQRGHYRRLVEQPRGYPAAGHPCVFSPRWSGISGNSRRGGGEPFSRKKSRSVGERGMGFFSSAAEARSVAMARRKTRASRCIGASTSQPGEIGGEKVNVTYLPAAGKKFLADSKIPRWGRLVASLHPPQTPCNACNDCNPCNEENPTSSTSAWWN